MADATQEYMDLGKLEKDVEARRRQVQSPAFSTLPSDIRDAFHTGLANATATCEKKKASLNKALNKLSETDFWPPMPSQNVGDMEAKLKEAKTMLGGLADSVGQLYKRIESLYEQRTGRPSAGPSTAAADEAAGGDGDTHNKKRRRLSGDGGDSAAVDTASPEMMREDVESIKDAIREIEDRLQEMENDMTQHSRNIMEQLEAKVDEKIEEIARSADISALVGDGGGGDQLGPQTAQTIQTFHENFAQADREIAELAQEVADLMPQLDTLQRENDRSKQEEAAEKELFEQVRSRCRSLSFSFSSILRRYVALGAAGEGRSGQC
jgi:DNA repair exonuclease SbcCD ATPase subunit